MNGTTAACADFTALLIKEGFLTKQGNIFKSWRRRYFVLEGQKISYYKRERDYQKSRGAASVGCITLGIGWTVEQCKGPERLGSHFKLTPPFDGRVYYLAADRPEEREEWITAINTICYGSKNEPVSKPMPRQEIIIGSQLQILRNQSVGHMTDTALSSLLQNIVETSNSDKRIELLKTTSTYVKSIACQQLSKLLESVDFAEERIVAIECFVPKLNDPDNGNFEKLILSRLNFENEKAKAQLLFKRKEPP